MTDELCSWCGLLPGDCPQPEEHARLDAESETTWRKRAQSRLAAAFLTPDEVHDVA
jgi:hypothetical protein